MKQINTIFDRMDAWRHLPSYQLERRADLFFSLYLAEVLSVKFGLPFQDQVIPEFPVRKSTIDNNHAGDKSYKIDYVALSTKADKAIFVELKTEMSSRRGIQDEYLCQACKVGFAALLEGVLKIFRATKSKRKYFCLLVHLKNMGLLEFPENMEKIMSQPRLHGVTEMSHKIRILPKITESIIVYVQPNGNGPDIISFGDFRSVVKKYDDPVSQRFAQSLKEWEYSKAGDKCIKLNSG